MEIILAKNITTNIFFYTFGYTYLFYYFICNFFHSHVVHTDCEILVILKTVKTANKRSLTFSIQVLLR